MRKLAKQVNELEPRPEFIFITGDLRQVFQKFNFHQKILFEKPQSNARPESNDEVVPGFMSSYRSAQV